MEFNREFRASYRDTENITAVHASDIVAASLGDTTMRKQDEAAKTKEVKKSDKPDSLSLLDQDIEAKDLTDRLVDKLTTSALREQKEVLGKQIKAEADKAVQEMLGKNQGKATDSVTISSKASVAAQGGGDLGLVFGLKKKEKELAQVSGGLLVDSVESSAGLSRSSELALKADQTKGVHSASLAQAPVEGKQQEVALKQYLLLFAESILQENKRPVVEVEQARQKLLQAGISTQKMQELEQGVNRRISLDLKQNIKQEFIKYALSYSDKKLSLDLLRNRTKFNDLTKIAKSVGLISDKVGGEEEVKNEARSELRVFVSDELDKQLMESKLQDGSAKAMVQAFDKFNTIASIAKFSSAGYFQQLQKKMDNLGLAYFVNPEKKGIKDTDFESNQNSGDEREGQGENPAAGHGAGSLEEQLRSLYMEQAVSPKILTQVTNFWKIYNLKSEMLKSGFSEEQLKKLQEEAKALARLHLMKMLRDALEERAALLVLKGPAFDVVNKKMKEALRGFRRLDMNFNKQEILALRDQVNALMFSVMREEYLKVEVALQANPLSRELKKRRDKYLAALVRLKKESRLLEDIRPKAFQDTRFSSDVKIIEAA